MKEEWREMEGEGETEDSLKEALLNGEVIWLELDNEEWENVE